QRAVGKRQSDAALRSVRSEAVALVTPPGILFRDGSGDMPVPPIGAPEPRALDDSTDSGLIKNIAWLTLVSGVERGAALVQAVLIARAIGITDYGVYGLI